MCVDIHVFAHPLARTCIPLTHCQFKHCQVTLNSTRPLTAKTATRNEAFKAVTSHACAYAVPSYYNFM